MPLGPEQRAHLEQSLSHAQEGEGFQRREVRAVRQGVVPDALVRPPVEAGQRILPRHMYTVASTALPHLPHNVRSTHGVKHTLAHSTLQELTATAPPILGPGPGTLSRPGLGQKAAPDAQHTRQDASQG